MKTCTVCHVEKPLTEFHKEKKNKTDGVAGKCKECRRQVMHIYYEKNKERFAESKRRNARIFYSRNREKIVEKNRIWREENAEHIKDLKQKHYQKNREKYIEANTKWREKKLKEDPTFAEKLKKYAAAYYQKNKEELKRKRKKS
jgi:phosphoribosyl-AMP cyclohydrolase